MCERKNIMQRLLMLSVMLLLLTACGSSASPADDAIVPVTATPAEATADDTASDSVDTTEEATEATDDAAAETGDDTESGAAYDPATIELDATYTFELPWQTEVRLNHPSGWDISDGSRLTLFSPDGYNFQISGSDDPTQNDPALQALDNINQTAPIETRTINGQTVYVSSIRSGNVLAATVDLADGDYAVIQMISRRGGDLEAMRPFLARLAASMQVVEASD
jgi:hypothetical protein